MNHTYAQTCDKPTSDTFTPRPIHTTLYDLIGAIDDRAGSDASDVVAAAVIHALRSYRVSCLGDFEGYRMILGEAISCSTVA